MKTTPEQAKDYAMMDDALMTIFMAYSEGDYDSPIFWKDATYVSNELGVTIEEYDLWINMLADLGDYTHKIDGDLTEGGKNVLIHQSSMVQLIEDFWFQHVAWEKVG